MNNPSRRSVLAGAVALAGSAWVPRAYAQEALDGDPAQMYAAITTEPFPVPAINLNRIRPQFLRSRVYYDTDAPADTIVIDPTHRYLYLTDGQGGAMRYGVGVGRQGFGWSGTAMIHDKREWPDWYPPKEMMARDPHVAAQMSKLQSGLGMHGGPGNPLGARAMYLFQNNKDTLYRIHGTVEPWTIGTSVSSGCIRMINQDVMDLYQRVGVGTTVKVLPSAGAVAQANAEQTPHRRVQQQIDPAVDDQGGYYDPDQLPPDDGTY